MKYLLSAILISFMGNIVYAQTKISFNGNMEQLDSQHKPKGWILGANPDQAKAYPVILDSMITKEGRYSLSINKMSEGGGYGVTTYVIPHTLKGKMIELKGYLKTQNVVRVLLGYG